MFCITSRFLEIQKKTKQNKKNTERRIKASAKRGGKTVLADAATFGER